MKNVTRAVFAATLASMTLQAHAADIDTRPLLSAMYSHTLNDEDRASENGQGWYLGAGKVLNKYWNLELGAFQSKFDARTAGGNRWTDRGGKLDGQFFYSRDPAFSPYFGLGLGAQRTEQRTASTSVSDTGALVDAGFGFLKFFDLGGRDVAFRADARYRWLFLDDAKFRNAGRGIDNLGEPIFKVGFVVPLGAKPVAAAPVAVALVPPAPVKPAPAPKPIDSDGDGVADAYDRCPGTPAGELVDGSGCAQSQLGAGPERKFDDVLFDFDKSELTAAGKAILDNAAEVVNSGAYKSLRVNIAGHTDWIGSDGYNQALSERRAITAKNYLIKKGVDASRIHTYAFGETQPVADNKTDEGRSLNRRDEIRTTADGE